MQPTMEVRPLRVMLIQDNKPICLTRCVGDLQLDIPTSWTIVKYKSRSVFQWNSLPQFQLFSEPQNYHQMREWGQFLSYLQRFGRVAVVHTDYFNFYILAPDGDQECTYCVVRLWIRNPALASDYKKNGVWVPRHPRCSIHYHNSYQESYKSERTLQNKQAFTCLSPSSLSSLEDIVMNPDSGNNIGDGNPHNACKSVKDVDIVDRELVSVIHMNQYKDVKMCRRTTQQPVSNEVIQIGSTTSDQDVMLSNFRQKNLVKTDPSYLTTLSQTHSAWIFGAIAELVDNSRDAHATRLDISVELLYSKKDGNKIPVLSIIDDGDGMTHNDILRMLSFGRKQANEDQDRIGKFGIGFKTGAMKLGRDALVVTQSSRSRSIAFLSQSYNEHKDNIEIPIVSYIKNERYMEIDLSIQSKEFADFNLSAIKEFSPFNEYLLGEQLGLFGKDGTGTQIFIWNLDKWGSDYTLVWNDGKGGESCHEGQGDILIRSRRIRSRLGQISREVPLDYSLQAYLEVLFLNPRMKIFVQHSLVKSHPLEKSLSRTVTFKGSIMARPIQLVFGRNQLEWERMNGGVFLYWRGRLIEAYKRVGGMKHNADVGRGVIGVADVTDIMHNGKGEVWVLNNKQGFQDCEAYAKLEDWMGGKADEYWDENYDNLNLETNDERYKPDHEWVQCDKCRKWRMLSSGFNTKSLPSQWFCYMPPFNGNCEAPEQKMETGVVTVAATRRQNDYEKSQTKSGQSSPPREVILADESRLDSHANDSWRKNAEARCEDWGQKERRSTRKPKSFHKLNLSASNNDLMPNHRRNFKRERNFKGTRPQGMEENSYDQNVEGKTQKFFRDARGHLKKYYRAYHN